MADPENAESGSWKRLGARIAAARAEQDVSLECIAVQAGLNERTVRNLIGGQRVRPSSVRKICKALKIDPDCDVKKSCVAGDRFGSYNLEHYEDYIGHFFAYRRGFADPGSILRTVYNIQWHVSEDGNRLKFKENQRYVKDDHLVDYSQEGDIYICNKTNIVQLLTANNGDLRLISVWRMQDACRSMCGIVATNAHVSFFNQPSAAAIYFKKANISPESDDLAAYVGQIHPNREEFDSVSQVLTNIEQNIGLFVLENGKKLLENRCKIDLSTNIAQMSIGNKSEDRSRSNKLATIDHARKSRQGK